MTKKLGTMLKPCVVCGTEFVLYTANVKACSPECKAVNKAKMELAWQMRARQERRALKPASGWSSVTLKRPCLIDRAVFLLFDSKPA